MKLLFLLIFCTISVLFVDAQSQIITGTLLPKKGESVTYLPKATDSQKSGANKQEPLQQAPKAQQDTSVKKIAAKKTIHSGNEKPVVKTKVPATKAPIPKGFIFNLPVVQGANNTPTAAPAIPLSIDESKPVDIPKSNTVAKPAITVSAAQSQFVAATNSLSTTATKASNEPLKYEEPPAGTGSWSAPPTNVSPAKLEPLVYGPPPVANTTTSSPSNDNTVGDKKSNLRSPKFKGVYKPALKKPILLVPMSPDDLEDGVPKKKETEPTAKVVEQPKSVEDLYPPLNYTVPAPATAANLRSPKIQGAYVASKNNPMILMPVPPEPTSGQQASGSGLVYQEPPAQTNNSPINSSSNNNATANAPSLSSQPNIFDENYRGKPAVASKPIYTKYKKTAPKSTATKAATKPANTAVQQPVKNKFKKTFLKPVRQTVTGSVSFNHQLFNKNIISLVA
ncbi:hypothetical protein ACFOW1_01375 [Parasediminibacterium paludis]|uniref:Uncharacterized protein n=1 Tax=Parasediminibacterium paludis TaxID=908966 RepID=A0ABV8PR23_9BACT